MKLPTEWPILVKRGGSIVRIYKHTNRKGERDYDEFKVASYDLSGKRRLQTFGDYEKAKKAAYAIVGSFADSDAVTLTGKPALAYRRAIEALKTTGTDLDLAATDFARAWQMLSGGSVIEAARYYAKKHPTQMPRKTVSEVVAEFIDAKTKAGKSEAYLCDIRSRCGKFARAFKVCILDVTANDIRAWLESLKVGARTFNNYRSLLGTLFEFAKTRGYLPKDHDELEAVEPMERPESDISVYTPQELEEIISRADPRFVPFVVIGAFAGLRSAEIERLDWREVNLNEGFIEVKAAKAKTAARRIVPILSNLAKWLAPYFAPSGRVVPFDDFGYQQQELCREIRDERGKLVRPAFKWKTNALRHSFISYRVAEIKDVPQVALEAGNSPRMVFTNYRQLVAERAAKAWFSIEPAPRQNVVTLASAA